MCLRLEATADRWPAPLSSTSESSELVRACCTEDRIKAVAVSVSISSIAPENRSDILNVRERWKKTTLSNDDVKQKIQVSKEP